MQEDVAQEVARWTVGEVRITQVVEMTSTIPPGFLFESVTPADVQAHGWLRPCHADAAGHLRSSIHCFIVESRGRRIVVDTCVGDDKERRIAGWHRKQSRFLADLAAAGFPPDTIDTVLCTHLHVDHVGWNTRWDGGRWVPTFPHARHLFGQTEFAFWAAQHDEESRQILADSVQPIVDAGRHVLVGSHHALTEEVRLGPTPGHTPGHVSVFIRSGGQEAVITGDLLHHPIQCARPALCSHFDHDPALSRRTRLAFLQQAFERGALVLGTHFARPSAGWLARDGAAWTLQAHRDA
jgi:glyoxylase-like metal-dependent hydrolase (beta-lactamase superfamily II)